MNGLSAGLDSPIRNGVIVSLAMVFALGAFLSGCQGSLFNLQGQNIQYADRVILKEGGQQTEQYRSDDLTVKYEYVRNGDSLKISGIVRFSNAMQSNFPTVNTFGLALVLADARGAVLAQQGLTTGYDMNAEEPLSFSRTMVVPARTALMAFSYGGRASSSGGTFGFGITEFWHDPVAR
jgi:hypothetical protein